VKPKTGRKKIVTANVLDLTSLSLGTRSGNDRAILRFIYDTFVKVDPELNVVAWAASSWKIVGPKTVDITLRDGMKFHDGKPVTMEDVQFTFQYLKDKKMANYKEIYDRIEKTEVLSDRQLRFHLTQPYGAFLDRTLTDAHILPKHIWEKIDDPDKYPNEKPIGSGPFKFGYWKRGEEIYFEANRDHFYPPKIEGFYRKAIPSLEGVIAALESKEIDIHHDRLDSENATRLEKFPHLTVVSTPNHGIYEMRGDLEKKPFSDLQFRKAISYAIPRKQYMAQVFGKAGHAASNTIIHPELKPWYNEKIAFDEYAPQKAREILKAAGYWWDGSGFLHYPK
jgi:peptide/nickel transport system substrate-binding protein